MNGDATEIRQRELSGERAADDVISGFSRFAHVGDLLGGRAGWHAGWGFFLIEAAATHAIWAALERENAIFHVGLKLGKNVGVILDELELGIAFFGPENFCRIGNGGREFRRGASCFGGLSGFPARYVRRLGIFRGLGRFDGLS